MFQSSPEHVKVFRRASSAIASIPQIVHPAVIAASPRSGSVIEEHAVDFEPIPSPIYRQILLRIPSMSPRCSYFLASLGRMTRMDLMA